MSIGAREREAIWRRLVERARGGDSPLFADHWAAYCEASALREATDGPLAVWTPEPETAAASNIGQLMSDLEISRYEDLHRWSAADRAAFWERAIHRLGVVWNREPATVLDGGGGHGAGCRPLSGAGLATPDPPPECPKRW